MAWTLIIKLCGSFGVRFWLESTLSMSPLRLWTPSSASWPLRCFSEALFSWPAFSEVFWKRLPELNVMGLCACLDSEQRIMAAMAMDARSTFLPDYASSMASLPARTSSCAR